LFDSVALSCPVGNGDAHLKNFGLLCTDPTLEDCLLAPAFGIVNTTSYLPEDVLTLSRWAAQNHSLHHARASLIWRVLATYVICTSGSKSCFWQWSA